MKRILAVLLALICVVTVFSACAEKKPAKVDSDVIDTSSDYYDDDFTSDYYDTESEDYYDDMGDDYDYGDVPADVIEEDKRSAAQKRAAAVQMGEDETYIKAGLLRNKKGKVVGNLNRMKKFANKMAKGGELKVVYFGGTNCAVDEGYADKVHSWLTGEFIGYVETYKAGYPGITSEEAVYRVKHDVVEQKPDIVFLDLAVEDAFGGTAANRAPYFENIVRRILRDCPNAAVVIISNVAAEVNSYRQNNSHPDPMVTAAKYHKEIAEFYGVPVIDFQESTWEVISTLVDKKPYGEVPLCSWPIFGTTNTALTDVGHKNLSAMIIDLIDMARETKITDKALKLASTSKTSSYLYKNNSHMTYDYIDFMDIYYLTSYSGYTKNKTTAGGYGFLTYVDENGKSWKSLSKWSKKADRNGSGQYLTGFRPLLESSTATRKDRAPIYMQIPEVTKTNKAYINFSVDPVTGGTTYVVCYDKDGKEISSKSSAIFRKHTETAQAWSYQKLWELPEGTCKVNLSIYYGAGYGNFYGISRSKTISNKKFVSY